MKIITSGKRKAAVARAVLIESKGIEVLINKRDYTNLAMFDKLKIDEPIRIAQNVLGKDKVNISAHIFVRGGGEKSQIDAARLALSRALIKLTNSKELRDAFIDYDRSLLVADVRRKEAYKPGDSKARAKRQTSYR